LTDRSVNDAMSPRSTEKNKEIRQESMMRIMNAAFTLIAKQGYESTSITQIARQAGVSKGLLYNYFRSKEELLQQLIEKAFSQSDGLIGQLADPRPEKTLENLFRWYFKELRERPDYWRLMTELTFKIDKFKFVHDMARDKMKAYVSFLQTLLEQLEYEDPPGEAKIVAALFDGIAIQYLVIRDNYPLDELEAYLINKYCKNNKSS
jgi:AcrR family transcriptional regulator